MLAKLWKKVLLAACIIACIFNIMSKLVSRTSLELNLKSVENGESILSIFKDKEESDESKDSVQAENGEAADSTIQSETNVITENSNQNEEESEASQTEETTSPITDFVVIY